MEQTGDDMLVVSSSHIRCELHFSECDALAALYTLRSGDTLADHLVDKLSQAPTPVAYAEFLYAVGLLHHAHALEYPMDADGVVVVPHSAEWTASQASSTSSELSRFARMRFERDVLLVESCIAPAHVEISSPQAITLLATALSGDGMNASLCVIDALASAGLLSDNDERIPSWTISDAEMHARSRTGNRGISSPPSILETRGYTPRISKSVLLPCPSVAVDAPLDDLLRRRRSVRLNPASPITVADLSALLARSSWETMRTLPNGKDAVARAYPSGGNCHSLDLYVAVSRCTGLDAGLYLYDRATHSLGTVAPAEIARRLVRDARRGAGEDDNGQILLILASDFAPVMNRYSGIAYSLILKEVGAALQTIQLVGTAMDLATCPIGAGDSVLFASALGSDAFEYTSVGEMLLGSAG